MDKYPTNSFAFSTEKGNPLMQMFVDQDGKVEWRKVPMIELNEKPKRKDSVAGFIPWEEE